MLDRSNRTVTMVVPHALQSALHTVGSLYFIQVASHPIQVLLVAHVNFIQYKFCPCDLDKFACDTAVF
jgi:hypothetical protein